MNVESQGPNLSIRQSIFRGLVWAFVAAIYSSLFVPLFEIVSQNHSVGASYLAAATAAGATGALFYSAMRLAIVVAAFGNIAVFVYLIAIGPGAVPEGAMVIGAIMGAIIGGVYGKFAKDSHVLCGDAKLLAGAVAGCVAAFVALPLLLVIPDAPLAVMIGLLGSV